MGSLHQFIDEPYRESFTPYLKLLNAHTHNLYTPYIHDSFINKVKSS